MRQTIFTIAFLFMLLAASAQESVVEHQRRGKELYEQGHWSDARHELLKALKGCTAEEQSRREEIEFYLAVVAVELGLSEAEEALLAFEERYPESFFRNDIRFARGSYYCTTGDYARARTTLDQVNYKALDPESRTKFDIRRGYLSFIENRYNEAYGYFERVSPQSPYGDHARYYIAYIDYTRGDYAKARQGFQALMESPSYRAVAPFYLLQLEFKQGNYTYVVDHGEELIRVASPTQQRDLRRMMAEAWFHLDNYTKSLAYITAYKESDGPYTRNDAYIEGYSLYRLARYEAAIEALRRAAGADDALTQNASYHLADCYLREGDKESARQAFALATNSQFNPTIAEDALYNQGKLLFESNEGRFGETIHILSRYLRDYPASERREEVQLLLGAAYYNSEEYDAAYEAIKALPSPDSEMRAALQKITYFRALKRLEAGDLEGAEADLRESAEIGISARYLSLSRFWRGEIAYIEGNWSEAKRLFESYLQRAPKQEREYALAHYNIAYCHFQQEAMPKAREGFDRFLELYPTSDLYRADAWNRAGDACYATRQFEEALTRYREGAKSPLTTRYYAQYQEAITLGILEQRSAKIALLNQIVENDRGDYVASANYELGRTYLSSGEYRLGASTLERFVERYPHSIHHTAALADLGLAHANLGNRRKALEYYERVIEEAPSSAEARGAQQGIRELYVAEGDIEGYFAYAERAGIASSLGDRQRDSLSFAAARSLYLEERTEDAARSLRSYIKSFPEGDYLSDALYYLSICYRTSGDEASEIEALAHLSDQGNTPYRIDALKRLCDLCNQPGREEQCASAALALSHYAPTREERSAALDRYVEVTLSQGHEEEILKMAEEVMGREEASVKALRKARYQAATIHRKRGDESRALSLYELLREEVRSAEGAEAMYRIIEHHFLKKDLPRTEELVFQFSEMPSPNNYWLAKSFLLLGDSYLLREDHFQARATYQSVVDGYSPADDGIVAEAKARIANLNTASE